jgi:hypothetical protein
MGICLEVIGEGLIIFERPLPVLQLNVRKYIDPAFHNQAQLLESSTEEMDMHYFEAESSLVGQCEKTVASSDLHSSS